VVFQIGEFSQLAQLSIRMLRHYDRIGLLPPAIVDASNGYRYYDLAQLRVAHRITSLKHLGLSLEQIGQLLAEDLTPEELRGMLRIESKRAIQDRDDAQRRLADLERHLATVQTEGVLDQVDLVERSIPRLPFLGTRVDGLDFAQAMDVAAGVVDAGRSAGIDGPLTIVSHSQSFVDSDLDLSMGFCVDLPGTRLEANGVPLVPGELPAVPRMVTAIHDGDHETGHRLSHTAIAEWLTRHDLRLDGGARETFHDLDSIASGSIVTGSGVVEISYPVAERTPRAATFPVDVAIARGGDEFRRTR
jgi:DNA-binding transcriptional MerR regulator